jgi:hypothetical protein
MSVCNLSYIPASVHSGEFPLALAPKLAFPPLFFRVAHYDLAGTSCMIIEEI